MNGDDVQDVDPHASVREPTRPTWRRFRNKVSRVSAWVWALPCFALAGIYAVVWWPSSAATSDSTSLTYFTLRWGHSVTWVLLALSFLVRSSTPSGSKRIANILAFIALIIYLLFLFVAVRSTFA